ncbi:PQQ-binding-like beta-propeller repeat protein [Halobacteriaceae archaeon GCM10025711]
MTPAEPPASRPSRRAFLAASGTAAATALAGCSALSDGDATGAFHDGDWHSYGNGPTNANRVAGGAPALVDHEPLAAAGWPYAPPVVHDGVAYFATERHVVAVAADGGERWSRRLGVAVSGAPAIDPDRGRLYVPTRVVRTTDGPDPAPASVTVLSLDGDVLDTLRVGDDRTYGVTVVDGDVYARGASACVRLAPDGTERWRRPLDPLVYDEFNLGDSTATQVAPAVAEDGVYVPDRDALVELDPETGEERWRVPVDTPYAASVVDDRGVVQTGWQETVAVDHSGEVRWRRDLHSRAAAAASDGDVYVVAGDLHELDAATGETNWQAHLSSEGTAAPVVTDDDVLVVSGGVSAFRRDADGFLGPDRERWRTSSVHATEYASPVVAAGRVFATGPFGLLALQPDADG